MKVQALIWFVLAVLCVLGALAYAVMGNRSISKAGTVTYVSQQPIIMSAPTVPKPTKPKSKPTEAPKVGPSTVMVIPALVATPHWRQRWLWEDSRHHHHHHRNGKPRWEDEPCACPLTFNPVCRGNRSWANNCWARCNNVFDATTCYDPKRHAYVI